MSGHVKEMQWLLRVAEADALIKLVGAGYEQGVHDHPTTRRFFLALKRMDLAEENPTCRGHWRLTAAAGKYYR